MVGYGVFTLVILAVQQTCAYSESATKVVVEGSNSTVLDNPSIGSAENHDTTVVPSNSSGPPAVNNHFDLEGDATDNTVSQSNSSALQIPLVMKDFLIKRRDLQDPNAPLVRRKRTFKKKKKGCMVCKILAPIMAMHSQQGCGMMGCGQPQYQPPPCGHPMSPCGGPPPPVYRPPPPPPPPMYHPPPTCDPCQRPQPVYHPPPPPPPPQQHCNTCQQGYPSGPGGSWSQSSSSSQSSAYSWGKK